MDQHGFSLSEISKRGQEIYDSRLKEALEREQMGKYVAIEIETGEYFLGDTLDEVLTHARAKYPNKIFHSVKIGATGVFSVSGMWRETHGFSWAF